MDKRRMQLHNFVRAVLIELSWTMISLVFKLSLCFSNKYGITWNMGYLCTPWPFFLQCRVTLQPSAPCRTVYRFKFIQEVAEWYHNMHKDLCFKSVRSRVPSHLMPPAVTSLCSPSWLGWPGSYSLPVGTGPSHELWPGDWEFSTRRD